MLMLISNSVVIPLAFGVGYISDKMKVWKLMLASGLLCLGFQILMVTAKN
jgi:hypothetical protein